MKTGKPVEAEIRFGDRSLSGSIIKDANVLLPD